MQLNWMYWDILALYFLSLALRMRGYIMEYGKDLANWVWNVYIWINDVQVSLYSIKIYSYEIQRCYGLFIFAPYIGWGSRGITCLFYSPTYIVINNHN